MLAFHYNNKLPSVADLLTEEQKAKAKAHNDWTQSDKSLKLVLDHILQSPQQLQKFKRLCQEEVQGLQGSSFPILRLDASMSAKEVMGKISKPPQAVKEAGAFVVQFAGGWGAGCYQGQTRFPAMDTGKRLHHKSQPLPSDGLAATQGHRQERATTQQ